MLYKCYINFNEVFLSFLKKKTNFKLTQIVNTGKIASIYIYIDKYCFIIFDSEIYSTLLHFVVLFFDNKV